MSFLLETNEFSPETVPLEETLFHCANGYLGVRGNFEEGTTGVPGSIQGTYVNAFYDTHTINHPEKLFGFPEVGERILNVTDAQSLKVRINGKDLKMDPVRISEYSRILDMRKGIVTRKNTWVGADDSEVRITSRRMASLVRPEIFCLEYTVTALGRVQLQLESLVNGDVENFSDPDDPRVSGEGFKSLKVLKSNAIGNLITVESRTRGTGFTLKVSAYHRLKKGNSFMGASVSENSVTGASLTWSLVLQPGESVVLEKQVRYRDSRRHPEGIPEDTDPKLWFDDLAAEQQTCLEEFWKASDISIEGDDHILAGLRYSLYNLLQSAPRDRDSGIPAKGLSGEGYEGHYFWDTEIYMLPFFLYTKPETARQLLEYRFATLEKAKAHARDLGHKRGAAYPWRTIAGRECSAYYPSGSAQYHINADIALAVGRYLEATGDSKFLLKYGAEILIETARIWMELGSFSGTSFHICGVTGPDEYTCMVDDNYYTNRMAGNNLVIAAEAVRTMKELSPGDFLKLAEKISLDETELEDWLTAAGKMFIPYDRKLDMNPQNAGFLNRPVWDFEADKENHEPLLLRYHHMTLSRHQVCKQADTVLAEVLLGRSKISTDTTMENNFTYYEKITTHDSSLSYAAFAIMALRLGDPEKALRYFRENASLDLDNRHGNTRDGIHAANMGGAWMSFTQGFGGFIPGRERPQFTPKLPSDWNSLEYRIRWRKSTINVRADHSEATFTLEEGPALTIEVFGQVLRLEDELVVQNP